MNWIIGDIHGMVRPLRALVKAVRSRDREASFFFVGDYINRGPDSKGVVDFLLDLDRARFGRGNHDDIFDLMLHGQCYVENPSATDAESAFRWFIQHGLWNTLSSYDIDAAEVDNAVVRPTPERIAQLFSAIPERHRTFFRSLEPVMEMPEFFVAHAMWNTDEPDSAPTILSRLADASRLRYQIIWGRFGREVSSPKFWQRTGYFGHTPVQTYPADLQGVENTPIRGPKIVLLDTAVALLSEGRLSAVCAETSDCIQVDRLGGIVDNAAV